MSSGESNPLNNVVGRVTETRYSAALAVILLLSVALNIMLVRRLNSLTVETSAPDLGMAMKPVSLEDITGKTMTIDFRSADTPTVLYVFRPTCGWCEKNLRNIKELAQHLERTGKGKVIGLSLDQNGLKEYVQKSDLGFPSYTNIPLNFKEEYRLGVTPHTLVVKRGKVVQDWRGAYAGDLQREVEKVFGVRLPGLAPSLPHMAEQH